MNQDWSCDPEGWSPPLVVLVGMGMGREDLSLKALEWVRRAEVLVGGTRHLDSFPEHTGEKIVLRSPIEASLGKLEEVFALRRTAVLASGDPFFFGIGSRLVKLIGQNRVLSFPNVTTVQTLFSRLAEPWEEVKAVSLHGRSRSSEQGDWIQELYRLRKLVLFTDPSHTPAWIAGQLCDAGMDHWTLVVAEDLGLSSEKIHRLPAAEARLRSFSPLNVVAVFSEPDRVERSAGSARPLLGVPDEAFEHQAGLITKMEVRAVVMAHLQLQPELVLWDLGAGSGSVSIEADRLASLRYVAAVEKDNDRYRQLQANVSAFRCINVEAIQGSALEVLDRLPDPDRVFIGGSGGDLRAMLEAVVRRLRPRGRVVQTAVALDTLEAARLFWQNQPFDTAITQLQVSRGVPIGRAVRLEALNPVFIMTAWTKS